MSYCGKCGTLNESSGRFCARCGAELTVPAAPTAYRAVSPLYETKIIQVNNIPSTINRSNEEWARFGWNVQNVQVTHSQDTRTYTKDLSDLYFGSKTVETTTINYATITYQRDKNMPNYDIIANLERQYNQIEEQQCYALDQFSYEPVSSSMLLAGIFIFPLLIYYIYRKSKESEAERKYSAYVNSSEFAELNAQKAQIANEAAKYLRY